MDCAAELGGCPVEGVGELDERDRGAARGRPPPGVSLGYSSQRKHRGPLRDVPAFDAPGAG